MNTKKRFIFDDFRISQESINYGWTMPYSHCHVAYEIYILKSGERTVTIEDMEYTAKAMDATLFSSNTSHKSKAEEILRFQEFVSIFQRGILICISPPQRKNSL